MDEKAVDDASAAYDQAEQAYVTALASGGDGVTLRSLARRTADAAQAWNSVDADAPPPSDIARYYEAPEVLATLWRDLADAHERRQQ